MTMRDISEIFTVWAMNWPSAELFQGGMQMLDSRCRIYAAQLAGVDHWEGLRGAARSMKTRRFPPNIAEFLEDIQAERAAAESEIENAYLFARSQIAIAEQCGDSPAEILNRLPRRAKIVIQTMGGLHAFKPPEDAFFNREGFRRTYLTLLRQTNALTGGRFEELPGSANRALPGQKGVST